MEGVRLSKKFIREILEKESWFSTIKKNKNIDFIVLTGSRVLKNSDKYSDIDLFLICSRKNQIKYSLKPMYEYFFNGIKIEISLVSREKLINDTYNKDNLYWWYNCKFIKSYNKNVLRYFNEASTIKKDELKDRLWTNWVRFEINTDSILKLIKRKDPLGIRILINENIKLIIDSVLADNHIFVHYKWQGWNIKKIDKSLYQYLQKINNLSNIKEIMKCNYRLRRRLFYLLKKYKFKNNELNKWSKHNLNRLTFQYR